MLRYAIQLDFTSFSAYSFDFLDAYKKAPHLPHWKIQGDAYDSPVFAEKFGGGEISSLFMVPHLQGGMSVEVLDTSVPIAVPDNVADYKDIELILLEVDIGGVHHLATIYAEEGLLGAGPGAALPEVYAYVTDHLGTPYKVLDESGSVMWEGVYDPFGVLVAEESAEDTNIIQNLRFPGQYHDRESDLHYNWHRYYQPEHGRYTRRDPIDIGRSRAASQFVRNRMLTSNLGNASPNYATAMRRAAMIMSTSPFFGSVDGASIASGLIASNSNTRLHPYGYARSSPLATSDPFGLLAYPDPSAYLKPNPGSGPHCQEQIVCERGLKWSCFWFALGAFFTGNPSAKAGTVPGGQMCSWMVESICRTEVKCPRNQCTQF